MTDVGTVTDRIVALLNDNAGITADDEYPDNEDAALPDNFCFVAEEGATFRLTDTNNVEVTQDWSLLLYGKKFETEITGEEDTAYQACRPFLTSIPKFFWQHKRLQRNDQGLTDVKAALLGEHLGIQSASRGNYEYQGIAFTLTVVYDMYIEEV